MSAVEAGAIAEYSFSKFANIPLVFTFTHVFVFFMLITELFLTCRNFGHFRAEGASWGTWTLTCTVSYRIWRTSTWGTISSCTWTGRSSGTWRSCSASDWTAIISRLSSREPFSRRWVHVPSRTWTWPQPVHAPQPEVVQGPEEAVQPQSEWKPFPGSPRGNLTMTSPGQHQLVLRWFDH